MNKISSFISSLRENGFRFQMWVAAVSFRHEYETNIALREFDALDSDDLVDVAADA